MLHNKCIRIFANAYYYAHVPPLARQMNIIKFDELFFIFFIQTYEVYPNVLLQSILKYFISTFSISLITGSLLMPSRIRLDVSKRFIALTGATEWFNVPIIFKVMPII